MDSPHSGTAYLCRTQKAVDKRDSHSAPMSAQPPSFLAAMPRLGTYSFLLRPALTPKPLSAGTAPVPSAISECANLISHLLRSFSPGAPVFGASSPLSSTFASTSTPSPVFQFGSQGNTCTFLSFSSSGLTVHHRQQYPPSVHPHHLTLPLALGKRRLSSLAVLRNNFQVRDPSCGAQQPS
jgi:hypothetical protein